MHRPAKLVIAALFGLSSSAFAGYAQLATPPGFGGSPAGWTYTANAANDTVFGRVIHQPNGLKVPIPGTSTTMSASYRLASNAPRIAAAAIFMSPQLRTGVAIAGWLITAKLVYDEAEKMWRERAEPTDGMEYRTSYPANSPWFPTREAACSWYAGTFISGTVGTVDLASGTCTAVYTDAQGVNYPQGNTGFQSRQGPGQCPTGWTATPAGCLSPQVQQPRFEELLNPANQPGWPMPERVPFELPGRPLPVEPPVINPEPGPNPVPRPRFVPTGDPVKNPNYNPQAEPSPENQPFIQPGVRVKPSPTPQEPLRVDLEPINVPKATDVPNPETDETDPNAQPKPEEQQSLCEKHPDIVACAKMDEVEPEDVNNEEKTLTITPKGGWGNESASCPAPVTKQVAGLSLEMSWQPFCDFASGIRPVVIAMAWLSAALMVLGIARKG